MASLDDILTSLKGAVNAINGVALAFNHQVPANSSGQLSVDTLVQTGFMRVTGISVGTAGAVGTLYDASSLAAAAAGNAIYVAPASLGYIPLNMVFTAGLVYKPGAGQKVTLFYSRN